MSCLVNLHHFSVLYKVSGKARLAGNGHSPFQKAQHSKKPCMTRPAGAFRIRRYSVASLANMFNITCGTRLVATYPEGSEIIQINRIGH